MHQAYRHMYQKVRNKVKLKRYTVDREIFALKIIRVKIFRVDKFSRFRSIREIF